MNNKQIEFYCDPGIENVIPHPAPAKRFIPSWFKNLPDEVNFNQLTIKKCVPFIDIMTSGYIIPLWQELHFYQYNKDGKEIIDYGWSTSVNNEGNEAVTNHYHYQIDGSCIANKQFGHMPMKFMSPWVIKTPPGYSCLFTAPFNRTDFDFQIISAVVDTDLYFDKINFPFIWTTPNFHGSLPIGLPLVQVIPFKRTDWKSAVKPLNKKMSEKKKEIFLKRVIRFKNMYRELIWNKKQYR